MTARKAISTQELDRRFDDGEDASGYIDWSMARRINAEPKRVNVDFPAWVVKALDAEAQRRGVTLQALIKLWIAERLNGSGQTGNQ